MFLSLQFPLKARAVAPVSKCEITNPTTEKAAHKY